MFFIYFEIFFFLKYLNFLSSLFGPFEKRLDWKEKVNFKFYDVAIWETNNCNVHIAQYLEKWRQSMTFSKLIE